MFWIGLIVVRIEFEKHQVFKSCDIGTLWNMEQIKVRVGVMGVPRSERMRAYGIKNVRATTSIRVIVMVWCKSRFLVNFSVDD